MVIIEGPDNSGKTTIARRLASELGMLYLNNRRKPNNWFDLDQDVYNFCQLSTIYSTIFDRWSPISEAVYGTVLRKTDWHVKDQFIQLHEYAAKFNPILIYCRPSIETLSNFSLDQMPGVKEKIKPLAVKYDQEMSFLGKYFKIETYNRDVNSYSRILTAVTAHLRGVLH